MANPILSRSSHTSKSTRSTVIKKRIQNFTMNKPAEASVFFTTKDQFVLGPAALQGLLEDHDKADLINLIDVRNAEDFNKGHLPWAVNLPSDQWNDTKVLMKDKINIIYCYSLDCPLAGQAAKVFADQGYSVMELTGGFESWREEGFKVEKMAHH